jgi:chromate transport protein ChrA
MGLPLILILVTFVFFILAFWRCKLDNWWFYSSSLLTAGIFLFTLFLIFAVKSSRNSETGLVLLIGAFYLPLVLLIPIIIFLMGFFRNRLISNNL